MRETTQGAKTWKQKLAFLLSLVLLFQLVLTVPLVVNAEQGAGTAVSQGEGTPDEGTPDEGIPDEGTPDDGTPDEGTPDEGTPDEGTPNESTPDEGTPDDGTPDEGIPDEGIPDEGTPDKGKPGEDTPLIKVEGVVGDPPVEEGRKPMDIYDLINVEKPDGNANIQTVLTQGGKPLESDIIDIDQDIAIEVSFGIPVLGDWLKAGQDNPGDVHYAIAGDHIIFPLPEALSFTGDLESVDLIFDKLHLGSVTFETKNNNVIEEASNEATIWAKVALNGGDAEKIFITSEPDEPFYSDVSASFELSLGFGDLENEQPGTHTIEILGKEYTYTIPATTTTMGYELVKESKGADLTTMTIPWTVTIKGVETTTVDGTESKTEKPMPISGFTFADGLSDVGELVDGTAGVTVTATDKRGNTVTIVPDSLAYKDDELSFTFQKNTSGEAEEDYYTDATINFSTKIPKDLSFVNGEATITNTAVVTGVDGMEWRDSAEAEIAPPSIEKDVISPTKTINYPDTLTWTITANPEAFTLKDVTIYDTLDHLGVPEGKALTIQSATLHKWDAQQEQWVADDNYQWDRTADVTDVDKVAALNSGEFPIGTITTKVQLVVVTKVPPLEEGEFVGAAITYKNSAKMTWENGPGNGVEIPEAPSIGVGYSAISKSGQLSTADGMPDVEWTVGVTPENQDTTNLKVIDVLVHGSDKRVLAGGTLHLYDKGTVNPNETSLEDALGLGATITLDSLSSVSVNQKYIDGFENKGTAHLALKQYAVKNGDAIVADLLVMTPESPAEKDSGQYSVSFKTRVLNPAVYALGGTVENKANLYIGERYLNQGHAKVEFPDNPLLKSALSVAEAQKVELSPPAQAPDGVSENTGTFHYEDKSVIFRLDVNQNQLNLTGAEQVGGGTYGAITVTDRLPSGWEHRPINETDFLIYEKGKQSDTLLEETALEKILEKKDGKFCTVVTGEDGRVSINFTFKELSKRYVILLKAGMTEETATDFFLSNATKTVINEAELSIPNAEGEFAKDDQKVKVTSQVLDKTGEGNQNGIINWSVTYNPHNVDWTAWEERNPGSVDASVFEIVDTMSPKIAPITDSKGNLVFEDNIALYELTGFKPETGTYAGETELSLGAVEAMVEYDRSDNRLKFKLGEKRNKAYRFAYKTVIVDAAKGEITNTVTLQGVGGTAPSSGASYQVADADANALATQWGFLKITKTNGSGDTKLPGAIFELAAGDGAPTTVLRTVTTNDKGEIRLYGIPVGDYILRETKAPDGYTGSGGVLPSYTVTVNKVDGQMKTTVNDSDSNQITVKNYKITDPVGNLWIEKQVGGNAGEPNRDFTFTMTLTSDNGPLDGSYSYLGSGDDMENGSIQSGDRFTLKHGQAINILGLPEGTQYRIEETAAEGYITAVSTGTATASFDVPAAPQVGTEAVGKIETGKTQQVVYHNKRDLGGLRIAKTVSGNQADGSRDFTFTIDLTLPSGAAFPAEGYAYTGDGGKESGVVTARERTVTLKHGQSIQMQGLPVGTTYTVTETDDGGYTTRITDQTGAVTTGTVITGAIAADVSGVASVENHKHWETSSLYVEKQVSGNRSNQEHEFTFAIGLTAPEGAVLPKDGYFYTRDDGEKGYIALEGDTITLKHGQSIRIEGLLVGTRYTITEGGEDLTGYTTTVVDEAGQEVTDVTISGTIAEGGASEAKYENYKHRTSSGSRPNPKPEAESAPKPALPPHSDANVWNALPPNLDATAGGVPLPASDDSSAPGPTADAGSQSGLDTGASTRPLLSIPTRNVPDPNDADAPEAFLLVDDQGVPQGRYTRVETEEGFIYMDENGVPLSAWNIPQTGDDMPLALWGLLLAASLAGLGVLLLGKSLRRKTK